MDEQNGGNMLLKGILNLGLPLGLSYLAVTSSENEINAEKKEIEKEDLKSYDLKSNDLPEKKLDKKQKGGFGSNLLLESALAIVPMALISLSDSDNEKNIKEKDYQKDAESVLTEVSSDSYNSEISNENQNSYNKDKFDVDINSESEKKQKMNYNLFGGNNESLSESISGKEENKLNDENDENIKVIKVEETKNIDTQSQTDKDMSELMKEYEEGGKELAKLQEEVKQKEINDFENKWYKTFPDQKKN